jgi:hypothetical protein
MTPEKNIALVTDLSAAFSCSDLPHILERFAPELVWFAAEDTQLSVEALG